MMNMGTELNFTKHKCMPIEMDNIQLKYLYSY